VLHVDLDQFLAAVELLRHPELRGRPVVVGGDGDPTKRGVVSTASYEARALGVGSGVPLRTALKRIPDAVFLPVDKEHYEAVSDEVYAALRGLDVAATPPMKLVVEPLGWDEAFLGVLTDDPEVVARDVQRAVLGATRLECTVGIGPNKLLAKIATGFGKPNGIYRLTHESWYAVMGDRPPEALWGIGSRTATKLAEMGIGTVRELADADVERLSARFGPTTGPWLAAIGQGRGSNRVDDTPWDRRSRGREVTFQEDIADWDRVVEQVRALARRVAGEVVDDGKPAVRVAVKVRYKPFFTETHSRVTSEPTTDAALIERAALEALERFESRRPVRLLGVRADYR
jgi:DNA polymerase IV